MRVLETDDDAFASPPPLTVSSGQPVHTRIERWLADVVVRLDAGDKLPAEGDLAASLGVSRMTLRQALAALEARGLVQRRRGRTGGTFVSRPRIDVDLTGLMGFTEQMRRSQVRAGARMVSAEVVTPPPSVSEALALGRRAQTFLVRRVRSANREPLALEETYLSTRDFPHLLEHRLTGSLYTLMRREYGLRPFSAQEALEPVVADEEQARLLGTTPGSALMLVTRTAYTEQGLPVEHAYDRYRSDRTRISLRTSITDRAAP